MTLGLWRGQDTFRHPPAKPHLMVPNRAPGLRYGPMEGRHLVAASCCKTGVRPLARQGLDRYRACSGDFFPVGGWSQAALRPTAWTKVSEIVDDALIEAISDSPDQLNADPNTGELTHAHWSRGVRQNAFAVHGGAVPPVPPPSSTGSPPVPPQAC